MALGLAKCNCFLADKFLKGAKYDCITVNVNKKVPPCRATGGSTEFVLHEVIYLSQEIVISSQ
mgnify:CR=1 FL=1